MKSWTNVRKRRLVSENDDAKNEEEDAADVEAELSIANASRERFRKQRVVLVIASFSLVAKKRALPDKRRE